MNGLQVASLSVSVKSANNVETTYWRLSGNQGPNWHHGQVPLPAAKEDFQIVIDGSVGGKFGDIAVDDLYVREKGCGFSPRKAAVYVPTVTPPLVITTTNPPIISEARVFHQTESRGPCLSPAGIQRPRSPTSWNTETRVSHQPESRDSGLPPAGIQRAGSPTSRNLESRVSHQPEFREPGLPPAGIQRPGSPTGRNPAAGT
ncbi:unnamed protein product [Acanthosepion pharaonis]|uniref:MAM domain-containing protein n=1 Tax=Acanthosepion pharaonis TaxID=158019 RepID=A0A812DH57_ACAPH|nr:unnamed protein product [Sepia pharaonis]